MAKGRNISIRENMRLASKVFEEYGGLIRVIIARNVEDQAVADDIYQDVFLSVIEEPIPSEGNIVGYLYRRITNDIIDEARTAKNYRKRLCKYSIFGDHEPVYQPPEMTAIQFEETQNMLNLMAEVLERYEARAIVRHYYHGDSIAEGAKLMNVRKRTFSHYLSVGLRKIREYLTEHESVRHFVC